MLDRHRGSSPRKGSGRLVVDTSLSVALRIGPFRRHGRLQAESQRILQRVHDLVHVRVVDEPLAASVARVR